MIGLDVHVTKIESVAVPAPIRATQEAGPTGYGLARRLARREVERLVAAPGKIPGPRATG